jgi:hypothetical protein
LGVAAAMNYNGDRFVDLVMSDPAGSLALYERKRNTDGLLALLPEQRAFWSEGTSVLNSHGVPQNQANPFLWVLSSSMIHPAAIQFPISKCSALSRLIVLDEVYDTFVESILSACPAPPVGDPALPSTFVQMLREL